MKELKYNGLPLKLLSDGQTNCRLNGFNIVSCTNFNRISSKSQESGWNQQEHKRILNDAKLTPKFLGKTSKTLAKNESLLNLNCSKLHQQTW